MGIFTLNQYQLQMRKGPIPKNIAEIIYELLYAPVAVLTRALVAWQVGKCQGSRRKREREREGN